ncbi:hypothetical protein HG536_0D03810 [Torulaspora globosa]|uniref:K Homology domain-containing protein n=1 Tax=Torulaspora globosa TaxID=48254 RepID=A0A7G3ZH73_9SACH|nr:uncharacterized protein HG536_0D03810 [Torulaspora globosa]QLL32859.1 hypothetical protein HG536_0D03810 [Torulaspora globosa]
MNVQIFSQFETSVFCDAPFICRTGRLWRSLDKRLRGIDAEKAIYFIPSNAEDIVLVNDGVLKWIYTVTGVAEGGYIEPTISITSGLNVNEASLVGFFRKSLDELSKEFDVEIAAQGKNQADGYDVHLIGLESHVLAAEPHFRSLLELYQASTHGGPEVFVDYFELDGYSLIPLVIGVDMANMRHLSRTYRTQVRLPPLVSHFSSSEGDVCRPHVLLSSDVHSLVLSAKKAILATVEMSQSSIYYHRLENVSPGKLLFIRKYYTSELKRMIIKYQSFIRVTESYVEFQAPCSTLLNSVIKVFTINILHQIVEIQITLTDDHSFTHDAIRAIVSDRECGPIVVMKLPGTESQLVLVKNHSFLQVGTASCATARPKSNEVMYHLSLILRALPQNSLRQLRAIFELHTDYEEFISGKKNGKVTRIMETVPSLIKLEKFLEDDNLFLILTADNFNDFSSAFSMVLNELPAEESFFIPELYHRPVIGAGGSVIQATMKKYNVFVRFSNSFFLPQNDLSHIRYDNVIIRCPYKNVSTILEAKRELNSLARGYGNAQARVLLRFSPGQYRHMLSFKRGAQMIGEIEKNYSVYIMFPFEEPANDYLLEIRGNDENPAEAAKELIKTCFGIERELKLNKPIKPTNDVYNSIVVPFKHAMQIEVTFSKSIVRLTYEQGSSLLPKAVQILTDYLKSQNLRIVSKDVTVDFIVTNDKPLM